MQTRNMDTIVSRFLERTARLGGVALDNIDVYDPRDMPTEEIVDRLRRGKEVRMHARNRRPVRRIPAGKAPNRLEENYLYSTRRFPALSNNTIGSGGIPVNNYTFFTAGIGGDGATMGFPTGFLLTDVETNFEGSGGQVVLGTNFVFNQIGISFNTDIATADAAILMEVGALRFAKAGGQYNINHGPPRLWPGGTGVDGYSTASAVTAAHNGSSDIRAVRKLTIPRVIREREQFSYTYAVPRTTLSKDGSTFGMSNFGLMTLWLWGATQIRVPT